jgi:hypothetical protein
VLPGIPRAISGETFDQDHRGNHWRPQALGAQSGDQRGSTGRAFGQAGDRARIQDQHEGGKALAGPCRAVGGDPLGDSLSAGMFLRGRLTKLREQPS